MGQAQNIDKVVKCWHILIVDFPREYVKYANKYHWTTYLEYIFKKKPSLLTNFSMICVNFTCYIQDVMASKGSAVARRHFPSIVFEKKLMIIPKNKCFSTCCWMAKTQGLSLTILEFLPCRASALFQQVIQDTDLTGCP
jgi:hypothetical protein